VVSVNGPDAIGDGLWNLGNAHLGKRSTLETFVPWAEAREVRFVPNTTAARLQLEGRRAKGVVLRSLGGGLSMVRVRKAVIVSGGVIASSHFLMRSGLGRPVGLNMSCNFALPAAFEFDEELLAFDGEQITPGATEAGNRAIFETYFNPPGALALTIPFFFDTHREILGGYARMVNFGALVGAEPNGIIDLRPDLLNGRAFNSVLGEHDQTNIRFALGTLLELGRAAGAHHAVMPTRPGTRVPLTPADIESFRRALEVPLRTKDLLLSTAHPQGGNRMAAQGSRFAASRVVDITGRVAQLDNVYVADASVFPTSLTVNPQWTIMAMSSRIAEHVLERTGCSSGR
jgi:choline dehydrogenase-like flavoprotein